LDVQVVPGDHYTVIQEPNVAQLAKEISGHLTALEGWLEPISA